MIGTKFYKPLSEETEIAYSEAAEWCNETQQAFIEDKGDWYEVVAIPEPTPEEQQQALMEQKKALRAEAVSRITVEVDGMVFDGDENAQQRMSRAINMARSQVEMMQADGIIVHNSYLDTYTYWVLADNTIAQVTARQLATALNLAGKAQTELWIKPYQPEEPVSEEVSDGEINE